MRTKIEAIFGLKSKLPARTPTTEKRFAATLTPALKVEMVLGDGRIDCVWTPDIPRRGLSRRELRRYREIRQEAINEVLRQAGLSGPSAVIEMG